jgi:hypothetical protein
MTGDFSGHQDVTSLCSGNTRILWNLRLSSSAILADVREHRNKGTVRKILLADVPTCLTLDFGFAVRVFHPNCQHLLSGRMTLGVTLYNLWRVATSCFRNLIITIFTKCFLTRVSKQCSVVHSRISKHNFANGVFRFLLVKLRE